jgi:hypothetical protein
MKSKLFTSVLALVITSGVLASLPAAAQQAEIQAHINFALNDGGRPIDDCNPGHPGCCNAMAQFFQPRSTDAWQAVQAAKYGFCYQAIALILPTQCHNPGAASLLASNQNLTCYELQQH